MNITYWVRKWSEEPDERSQEMPEGMQMIGKLGQVKLNMDRQLPEEPFNFMGQKQIIVIQGMVDQKAGDHE